MKKYEKKESYRSFLGTEIREYIEIRSALNYNMDMTGYTLREFDSYLCRHRITDTERLTASFFLDWIEEEALELTPKTIGGKISILKVFCNYLVRFELLKQNPLDCFPAIKPLQYIPYVLSRKELKKILHIAYTQIFEDRNYFYARWAHYAIIYTVYACGLRISECLKLKSQDIAWDERTLFIRETKFGKNRIIPFHRKMGDILEKYRGVRDRRFSSSSESDWFFVSCKNIRYHRNTLLSRFQRLLREAGITDKRMLRGNVIYGGPTLHSLRHSFAVHRLMRWYEEGINPNDKLHLLATYMGHYNYEYTHHYLRLCAPLRKLAGKRFAGRFDKLSWIEREEDDRTEA